MTSPLPRQPGSRVVIYEAGHVVTMSGPDCQSFAVRDGQVLATGTTEALQRDHPHAEHVSWPGATIIPGLNDAHLHIAQAADIMLEVDLSYPGVSSLAQLKAKITEAARDVEPGSWILAASYDDGKVSGGRLTRVELDAAAGSHPVLVNHVAGHWGVLNTRGLQAAGFSDDSPDPDGGALGRDPAGHLDGTVFEQAMFDVAYPQLSRRGTTIIEQPGMERRLQGLTLAQKRFHAAGLTSVGDALVGPDDIDMLLQARNRGLLTMRVGMLLSAEYYDRYDELVAAVGDDDLLKIMGVKGFIDGALGGRTCLVEEPFEGTQDHGIQSRSRGELQDLVHRAQADGIRVGIHANGDRGITMVVDELESAAGRFPRPGLHHRIEHCSIVTPELVRRIARLGCAVTPFGSYAYYHGGKLLDWYGQDRVNRMFAHRWFLDEKVCVAGASDYFCGPYQPLLGIQSCVTRTGFDGAPVGTNQRITPREALACYTVNSAVAAGDGATRGRLAPGFAADFTVLGTDPTVAPADSLAQTPVVATYIGGAPVWTKSP